MMDVINNSSKKYKQERVNLLGYITPILMDYAENNRVDPVVCYEVCHELELMVEEQCKGTVQSKRNHNRRTPTLQDSSRGKLQGIQRFVD
jgi:hypothetical protein